MAKRVSKTRVLKGWPAADVEQLLGDLTHNHPRFAEMPAESRFAWRAAAGAVLSMRAAEETNPGLFTLDAA